MRLDEHLGISAFLALAIALRRQALTQACLHAKK